MDVKLVLAAVFTGCFACVTADREEHYRRCSSTYAEPPEYRQFAPCTQWPNVNCQYKRVGFPQFYATDWNDCVAACPPAPEDLNVTFYRQYAKGTLYTGANMSWTLSRQGNWNNFDGFAVRIRTELNSSSIEDLDRYLKVNISEKDFVEGKNTFFFDCGFPLRDNLIADFSVASLSHLGFNQTTGYQVIKERIPSDVEAVVNQQPFARNLTVTLVVTSCLLVVAVSLAAVLCYKSHQTKNNDAARDSMKAQEDTLLETLSTQNTVGEYTTAEKVSQSPSNQRDQRVSVDCPMILLIYCNTSPGHVAVCEEFGRVLEKILQCDVTLIHHIEKKDSQTVAESIQLEINIADFVIIVSSDDLTEIVQRDFNCDNTHGELMFTTKTHTAVQSIRRDLAQDKSTNRKFITVVFKTPTGSEPATKHLSLLEPYTLMSQMNKFLLLLYHTGFKPLSQAEFTRYVENPHADPCLKQPIESCIPCMIDKLQTLIGTKGNVANPGEVFIAQHFDERVPFPNGYITLPTRSRIYDGNISLPLAEDLNATSLPDHYPRSTVDGSTTGTSDIVNMTNQDSMAKDRIIAMLANRGHYSPTYADCEQVISV